MNAIKMYSTFFMTRRSIYLVYFKVEWDFINNLTLSHGSQVPQDAPMKKEFQNLVSLVNSIYYITLFGELQSMVSHLRPQEVLQGKKLTLFNPEFPKLNVSLIVRNCNI